MFPTAKKEGELDHEIGHCKYMKGATFNEKGHFSFAIKQLEQAN